MRDVVAMVACSGCAVTASTCPSGTRLTSAQHAEWCVRDDTPIAALPVAGSTYAGTLSLIRPMEMQGGVEGPFTSWYPDKTLKSHGAYASDGPRAVPDGLWAFWYPDGKRQVIGVYRRGVATGCFAQWDPDGKRSTGLVAGDQLHVQPCTPPDDHEIQIVEGVAPATADDAPYADLALQGFWAPSAFGASNAMQVSPDPRLQLAFGAAARVHLGNLRFGPIATVRTSDADGYLAYTAGGTVAWELPRFHPRISTEIALELSAEHLAITAQHTGDPATANVAFWTPLPAASAGIGVLLSPTVEGVATFRVDGWSSHDVARDVAYCDLACEPTVHETWRVGGFAYGLTLGVRLRIR